jgi:hypothetical protein
VSALNLFTSASLLEQRTMTNAADATTVVENLAEAMVLESALAELMPHADSATLTLPEEHPAPWSYQEEQGGHPVPWNYQEDLNVYTDDARRRHVVRDAHGGVVVQCVKFSKNEEEKLARFIASIPAKMAEIERLEAIIAELTADNRCISDLEAECSRLRVLIRELCEVLLKTSFGQRGRGRDLRITVAAKLLIDANINFSDLVIVLAQTVLDATEVGAASCCAAGAQADGGAA